MYVTTLKRSAMFTLCILAGSATATAENPPWAMEMFQKPSHDFKVVATGSEATYRFVVTNTHKQQVHIANVRTTCGCSAARPSRDILESGEKAYIEVSMDTRKFKHRKDSNVIVTFDAPQYAEVRLPITAYIRTDVVLTPGAVNFGAVPKGSESKKTIGIAYAGRADWAITKVVAKNPHMTAKIVEKSRENGLVNYELTVDLRGNAVVGDLRDLLILHTNDMKSPRVPVLVEGRVEAEITVSPRSISFGVLKAGQEKTVNIVLRGRKPFEIEKIESESGNEAYQVRLPTTTKVVHVLPLSIKTPSDAGKFSEEFTLTIKGMKEPVQFKVAGEVLPETAINKN